MRTFAIQIGSVKIGRCCRDGARPVSM